jgi:hypothetical protein
MLNIAAPAAIRRELEPVLLAQLLLLLTMVPRVRQTAQRVALQLAALFLSAVMCLECVLLLPPIQQQISVTRLQDAASMVHFALTQCFLLSMLAVCSLFLRGGRNAGEYPAGSSQAVKPVLIAAVLLLLCFPPMLRAAIGQRRLPLAGVHYYSWFPENWIAGYVGEKLLPPVEPALGRYNSADVEVVEQHLDWLNRAGVRLLIFDWWLRNPAVSRRIRKQVDILSAHKDVLYAFQFETLDLKRPGETSAEDAGDNIVYLSPERAERMKKQWLALARKYMSAPNYFRINGRPVLFLYATRHVIGPVAEEIQAAREYVRRETGENLFLVGDEVYYHVLSYRKSQGAYLLPELQANWSRLAAFDALTCYNPYDASRTEHSGSQGFDTYLRDVSELYEVYERYAATAGLMFIPGVLPGYNDRGVRPAEGHFVIPREVGGLNVFDVSLQRLVRPFLQSDFPFFAVTSWNEWNEGTQIEPSAESPRTDEDRSGTAAYTQGEWYRGYSTEYLDILAAFLKSLNDT